MSAPPDDAIALYEAKAGFARPENTVAASIALAQRSDADLHFGESLLSWESTSSGVRVRAAGGTYWAGELVVAPGAWAPQLLADLGVPITIERQVMYWFQPTGGVDPYLTGRQPIFICEDVAGVQIYGFPATDGPRGGVKTGFFRRGRICSPETIDREVHDDEVAEMGVYAGRLLPALPGRFLTASTCMYANTPDQNFVVARHPEQEHVTVACGFSGHGFKFVPVIGEVLADLATTGTTDHPLSLFDPPRPGLLHPLEVHP